MVLKNAIKLVYVDEFKHSPAEQTSTDLNFGHGRIDHEDKQEVAVSSKTLI